MKQLLRLLFLSLSAGLWFSLDNALCQNVEKDGNNSSYCYNTNFGSTCFTTLLDNNGKPARMKFDDARQWCTARVPSSSLIRISSPQSQTEVRTFLGRVLLMNETIVMDARKVYGRHVQWKWLNDHSAVPGDVSQDHSVDGACVEMKNDQSLSYCYDHSKSALPFICEYPGEIMSSDSYRLNNKCYAARQMQATWFDARNECLRLGCDLASITDLQAIRNWPRLKGTRNQRYWIGLHKNRWIWNSTGAALTYWNWEGGYPEDDDQKQCICIRPRCSSNICDYDRKWLTCNCSSSSYAVVCHKEEVISGTSAALTGNMLSSTASVKSFASLSVITNASSHRSSPSTTTAGSPSKRITSALSKANTTASSTTSTTIITTSTKAIPAPPKSTIPVTISLSQPIIPTANPYTTTLTDHSSGKDSRKNNWGSSMTHTQSNQYSDSRTTVYSTSSTGLSSSFGGKEALIIVCLLLVIALIFVAVFLFIRKRKKRNLESSPKKTNQNETISSTYASVVPDNRPTDGTAPSGTSIYADVKMVEQQSTPSKNIIYASVQPTGKAVDMGRNVEYAELSFQPKEQQRSKSADKFLDSINDQLNERSKTANDAVYAEPIRPGKVPKEGAAAVLDQQAPDDQDRKPTTGEAAKTTDLVYQEAIEVRPGAESGDGSGAIQDSSAVYAEPMKLKKGWPVIV